MFQNIAITFAIVLAIVVSLKAIIDVKNANKALDEDEADEASKAPYKVETPMEEYPVVEAPIVEASDTTKNRPYADNAVVEPITKPKRKRRKKTPVVPPTV
jgi:hypothetical protein